MSRIEDVEPDGSNRDDASEAGPGLGAGWSRLLSEVLADPWRFLRLLILLGVVTGLIIVIVKFGGLNLSDVLRWR